MMHVVMKVSENDGESRPIFATPHLALAKVHAEAHAKLDGYSDVRWDKNCMALTRYSLIEEDDVTLYYIQAVPYDLGGTVA